MGLVNATDLGGRFDLEALPDDRHSSPFEYLGMLGPWSMAEHAAAYLGLGPCPVCEGKPLGRLAYCLGCDRSGLDQVVVMPGLAVDEAPDREWHDEQARKAMVARGETPERRKRFRPIRHGRRKRA